MTWKNFNLAIRIKLDAGAQKLLFVVCLFLTVGWSTLSKVVLEKLEFIVGALGVAFGVGLFQTYKSNTLDVEAAKSNLADPLTKIKMATLGQQAETPANGCTTK